MNLNPESPGSEERQLSKTWEKATRGLGEGLYKVRLEIWGTLGQHRSREPIATGGFRLKVGVGDTVALLDEFPAESYTAEDVEAI